MKINEIEDLIESEKRLLARNYSNIIVAKSQNRELVKAGNFAALAILIRLEQVRPYHFGRIQILEEIRTMLQKTAMTERS